MTNQDCFLPSAKKKIFFKRKQLARVERKQEVSKQASSQLVPFAVANNTSAINTDWLADNVWHSTDYINVLSPLKTIILHVCVRARGQSRKAPAKNTTASPQTLLSLRLTRRKTHREKLSDWIVKQRTSTVSQAARQTGTRPNQNVECLLLIKRHKDPGRTFCAKQHRQN